MVDKITVMCHKDHDKGYEDFQGKCLLCVVDELMLEIGSLMIQKQRAEKREWVGLTDKERVSFFTKSQNKFWDWDDGVDIEAFIRAIEAKLKEKNGG